jgi:hypothetical protein
MKKILAWVMGLLILATPASAFWVEEEMLKDPRPYKVIRSHDPMLPNAAVITDIWVDESGYIIFIDRNNDGIEDTAHVHANAFQLEDGTAVIVCYGDVNPIEARKHIQEYIRLHSAAQGGKDEETISKLSSSGDDLGRMRRDASSESGTII